MEVIAAYLHKWRCLDSLSNSLLRRLASAAYLEDLDDGVTRNNLHHSIFGYRYLTLFTCRINSLPTRRPRDQLVFHPQRRSRHDHIQRQQQRRQLPPREFEILVRCPDVFEIQPAATQISVLFFCCPSGGRIGSPLASLNIRHPPLCVNGSSRAPVCLSSTILRLDCLSHAENLNARNIRRRSLLNKSAPPPFE